MIRSNFSRPKVLTRIALAAGLLSAITFTSCKKVDTSQTAKPSDVMKTMSGQMRLTINMEDVYAALPLQTMYNFRKELSFYPERSDWLYTKEYLQVRIPTTRSNNDFVYALKRYDNPSVTSVYIVHFTPDADCNEKEFSGDQTWLNLQDNRVYTLRYKRNKVVGHAAPSAPIAPVGWEKTMMARGAFSINAAGKMELGDPSSYSRNVLPMSGDVPDLPSDFDQFGIDYGVENVSRAPDGSIIIIVAPVTGPPVAFDNGTGYGNGLGWDWDWARQPGGNGSGSVRPPVDVPPVDVSEIPIAANGHNFNQLGLNGNIMASHWYDPTSLAVALVASTLHLNTTQIAWLNQHEDVAIGIRDYLLLYVPGLTPSQKEEIARRHLQMMMENPGYLDFVEHYDQNYPTGPNVLELADYPFIPQSPTHPISNRNEYLKCFSNTQGATYKVTLAVDQPVPNTRKAFKLFSNGNACDVGHTFLILEQNLNGAKTTRSIGWYPAGITTPVNPVDPAVLNNDAGHHYDIALVNNIDGANFMDIINTIKNDPHANYDLNDYNCTNWAYNKVFLHPMDNIDATYGYWPLGYGMNPGDLGQDIRPGFIILHSYQSITMNGNAPANEGSCP